MFPRHLGGSAFFFFFTMGPNLRHFNDTVQNTSTVGFENLLQMCDATSLNTHTCAHTPAAKERENLLGNRAQRLQGVQSTARRFIIPFKNTRVHSHALTCGLGAWRRWDTRSSLHLNGASHINHLIRISLTALKLMKSISWTFIRRLIDNIKKRRGNTYS